MSTTIDAVTTTPPTPSPDAATPAATPVATDAATTTAAAAAPTPAAEPTVTPAVPAEAQAVPTTPPTFVPAEVLSQAGTMNKPQADLCGFGAVKVDDAGRVLLINRYMSEMSGISSKAADGKNYFTQVNPCTNNPMFFGVFKRGVGNDVMDESFDYVFTYQMRPTNVKIHLFRDGLSKSNWIFVKKAA